MPTVARSGGWRISAPKSPALEGMSMKPETRSQMVAAALIMIGAVVVIYFLPSLVLWIGQYSPALAFIVGAILLLGFFWIFWLRARYQRRR